MKSSELQSGNSPIGPCSIAVFKRSHALNKFGFDYAFMVGDDVHEYIGMDVLFYTIIRSYRYLSDGVTDIWSLNHTERNQFIDELILLAGEDLFYRFIDGPEEELTTLQENLYENSVELLESIVYGDYFDDLCRFIRRIVRYGRGGEVEFINILKRKVVIGYGK